MMHECPRCGDTYYSRHVCSYIGNVLDIIEMWDLPGQLRYLDMAAQDNEVNPNEKALGVVGRR